MRRKDREVTEETRIDEIIRACDCCRLGFSDGRQVYIVPLSFGYTSENGCRTFYFHSAKEGRKLELMRRGGSVGFELDTNFRLNGAETACGHSLRFQSVIGSGRITFAETEDEKREGLQRIMEQYTGRGGWTFEEKMLAETCVYRLTVEELSCKEHA